MSNTVHRAYPKPVPTNNVSDDVLVLQQAMDLVDGDIHLLFAAIAELAPVSHEHVIADITGLSAELAGKAAVDHTHTLEDLSDVGGTVAAPAGYLLVKQSDGTWGPASPASVVGAHQHVISDVVNLQTALDGLTGQNQILNAVDTTVSDADHFGIRKFSNGTFIKRTWTQLKASVFAGWGALIATGTSKPIVIDADVIDLADSAAANATRKVSFLELWDNYFKVKANALYQPLKTILTTLGNLANGNGYLKNDGAGALSWGTVTSIAHIKETLFEVNGTFTPDPDAVVTQIVAVGQGVGGNTGTGGSAGKGAAAVAVSGSKAEVGNGAITVNMGVAANTNSADGTSLTFGSLITIQSLRRGSATAPTASTNLPKSTPYPSSGPNHNVPYLLKDWGNAGSAGTNSNANQSGSGGGPGGPGVVLVREYLST
jgi:hypothetical protein